VTELSSPYRASRRNTSLICGIGLAWPAARFDITSTSISILENINLEGAIDLLKGTERLNVKVLAPNLLGFSSLPEPNGKKL
jgi:hypothetical protein